jgi:hypothetical protein
LFSRVDVGVADGDEEVVDADGDCRLADWDMRAMSEFKLVVLELELAETRIVSEGCCCWFSAAKSVSFISRDGSVLDKCTRATKILLIALRI